jgi:hypothetical protein
MSKRVRLDQKIKSKSKSVTSAPVPRVRVFGQPQVLEGEDGKLSTNARLWAGRAPHLPKPSPADKGQPVNCQVLDRRIAADQGCAAR